MKKERKKLIAFSIEESILNKLQKMSDEFYDGNLSILFRLTMKKLIKEYEDEGGNI